jgi:hypothetical protein
MAEFMLFVPELMHKIIGYSCYCDEAIMLLNSLSYDTLKICSENFKLLLNTLSKRTVTIDNRTQHNLKDPRLIYFQVNFVMNLNFNISDMKNFVVYFDELLNSRSNEDDNLASDLMQKLNLKEERSVED